MFEEQRGKSIAEKYMMINSSDELYKSFMNNRHDLHYALKKEVSRDRFVVNEEALTKAIQEACGQALEEASEPLAQYIESLAYDVFSGFATGSKTKTIENKFIKIFVKAFIKSAFKIFEQNMNNK